MAPRGRGQASERPALSKDGVQGAWPSVKPTRRRWAQTSDDRRTHVEARQVGRAGGGPGGCGAGAERLPRPGEERGRAGWGGAREAGRPPCKPGPGKIQAAPAGKVESWVVPAAARGGWCWGPGRRSDKKRAWVKKERAAKEGREIPAGVETASPGDAADTLSPSPRYPSACASKQASKRSPGGRLGLGGRQGPDACPTLSSASPEKKKSDADPLNHATCLARVEARAKGETLIVPGWACRGREPSPGAQPGFPASLPSPSRP